MSAPFRLPVADAAPSMSRSPCGTLWIDVAGELCGLRCSGAVWLRERGVLVAGDLHLEKGSAYAARGSLLPPYDTDATLDRLEREVGAVAPRVLVLLGDSFHDPRAVARLAPANARRIAALAEGRTLVWAEGNHDRRGDETALQGLPGEVVDALSIGRLVLRHEPLAGPSPGEVAGHLHPAVLLVARGRGVRRRAFLTDGERLVLPAFGAYAGGLNVLDAAFAGLFRRQPVAAALGRDRVRALALASLSRDG